MLTPKYLAWLALVAIYREPEHFDRIVMVGCDRLGIKEVDGVLTITIEGTIDAAMWSNNLDCLPKYHPVFGNMHTGFLQSAQAIYKAVKPMINVPVAIQGHSRGAALAVILAMLCANDGIKVSQLSLFECPTPGYQRFSDYCEDQVRVDMVCLVISTVNGLDPVPYMPGCLFVAPFSDRINLESAPGGIADADPIEWHDARLIYDAYLSHIELGKTS